MRKILEGLGWLMVMLFAITGIVASLINLPPNDRYNPGFVQYSTVSLLHFLPGILFMLIGPLQFMPGLRRKYPRWHRMAGKVFMLSTVAILLSASWLVWKVPYGGLSEEISTGLFVLIAGFSLWKAWTSIRQRKVAQHREWIIRVFSIGLGVGSIRMFMVLLQITVGYNFQEAFPIAFWIGFSTCYLVGEAWIWYTSATAR